MYKYIIRLSILLLGLLTIISCSVNPKKPIDCPLSSKNFESQVRILTNDLLRQLENAQIKSGELKEGKLTKTSILFSPFMYSNTGELVKIYTNETDMQFDINSLERIFSEELDKSRACSNETCNDSKCRKYKYVCPLQSNRKCPKRFANFSIKEISEKNLNEDFDYIVYGIIEIDEIAEKNKVQKYSLYSSVFDIENNKIVAKKEIKIPSPSIKKWEIYTDIPLYLKDSELRHLIYRTKDIEMGSKIKVNNIVDAILLDAARAYEKENFKLAKKLYHRVSKIQGHQKKLLTWAALLVSNKKLDNDIQSSLKMLIKEGIINKEFMTKILFEQNSIDLKKGKETEYKLFLKYLGEAIDRNNENFKNTKKCLSITGHTSKTGTEKYNETLSNARARLIDRMILKPEQGTTRELKSIYSGKGSNECEICIPNDDEDTAIDRRVEINIVDCK